MSGWDLSPGISSGVLRVDADTLAPVQFIGGEVFAGPVRPTGTSIDVDGGVWLVDSDPSQALGLMCICM